MATSIFVNLPVSDLDRSKDFFSRLGYTFNPQFTDEKAACMVISDTIYVMLITEPYFKTFTRKEVADARNTTEAIIALSAASREAVEEVYNKAIDAGGKESLPAQDYGFMYQRSFQDPDGHMWEVVYVDLAAMPQKEDTTLAMA